MALLTVNGSGRLGADCELRFTKSGTPVLSFNLATSNLVRDPGSQSGFSETPTTWVKVSLYGKRAEDLAGELRKGVKVFVSGELIQESWDTANGEKRSQHSIRAKVVALDGEPKEKPAAAPSDPWASMPAPKESEQDSVPF
jgi:single-strand DNA-binding protein